jgi:uncharacterized protein YjiS (DUF1127 family)
MSRSFSSLASLRRRFSDWWTRRLTLRELDRCDERELARILQDINVTKAELSAVVTRGAFPKLQLPEMLEAHGIRPEQLKAEHPAVEADLRRVCAQCAETRRCRHELDADTAATGYREFCNNAATIEALLAETADEVKKQEKPGTPVASGPGMQKS